MAILSTTYNVTLQVTDSGSPAQVATAVIQVSPTAAPIPLSVLLVASTVQGYAPLTVNFSAVVTGGTPPHLYAWYFGDGGASAAPAPTKIYSTPGNYLARVSVADSSGSAQSERTISVLAVPPVDALVVPIIFVANP